MAMKFALRDDDLNYFFDAKVIENNYRDIWDICPISMSVVPFIKGYWPKIVIEAEERGPGQMADSLIKDLRKDNHIFPIDENIELVEYVKEKVKTNKIYLTIHAIHHRNEDKVMPQFTNNYGFGAEFYTTRDLTLPLSESIKYLENVFEQKIEVFTPPQNKFNMKGLMAVINNNLMVCGDFPSIKDINTIRLFGLMEFVNYFSYKLFYRSSQFPYPILNKQFKMVGHHRLQLGTNIEGLYAALDHAHKSNGVFVISTHSYGFGFKMKNSELTMKDELMRLIDYAKNKGNIEFVNLKQIFEKSCYR